MTTTQAVKHTPGPWTTNGWTSHGMVISVLKDDEGIGCGKYIGYAQGYPHPDAHEVGMPEAEANARLIAQAPAMAEALKKVIADLACYCPLHSVAKDHPCGRCEAEQVLRDAGVEL